MGNFLTFKFSRISKHKPHFFMPESNDIVQPPASASENAYLKNMEEYQSMYQRSIDDPDCFWSEVAEDFHWYSKWEQVRRYNYDRREGPISIEWFKGAKTNVCYNCVDRHSSRHDRIKLRLSGKVMNRERMPRFPTDNCINRYLNLPMS